MPKRKTAEILQDLPFHRRQWIVQRIGWILALLVLALALAGLFGDGPLSHVSAGNESLRVEYERFIRRDSSTEIHFDARPSAANEIRIGLSSDYLEELRIDSIVPDPERVETTGREVVFVFRAAPDTSSARITVNATALKAGSLHATARDAGSAESSDIPIQQFAWP